MGSSKSTQIGLLAERLQASGRHVLRTREPGGAPGAERLRCLLLDDGQVFLLNFVMLLYRVLLNVALIRKQVRAACGQF